MKRGSQAKKNKSAGKKTGRRGNFSTLACNWKCTGMKRGTHWHEILNSFPKDKVTLAE